MNEMLFLMCKSLNSTSTITSNNYSHISSSTGTNCNNVKIYKNDYLKLSNELIKYYTTNNENPQKITINNETLTFDDAVYFYARAVAWKYNNKGTLPNYGTVIALYNNDYSTDENALISQTNQSFTINTNITKLENGNYNISNPYYAENAAISIFMSCLPGSGEVKIARIAEKALINKLQ